MKKNDSVYYMGIVIVIVSMINLSRYYQGFIVNLSLVTFVIGFAMVLSGYFK